MDDWRNRVMDLPVAIRRIPLCRIPIPEALSDACSFIASAEGIWKSYRSMYEYCLRIEYIPIPSDMTLHLLVLNDGIVCTPSLVKIREMAPVSSSL